MWRKRVIRKMRCDMSKASSRRVRTDFGKRIKELGISSEVKNTLPAA